MGGSSIFRVLKDDPNRNVIVETLTAFGARSIMAQRYLPAITQGDKRILLIAGEPVPYCLARIPKPGEIARQPRRRRQGRGAAAARSRPRNRRGAGADLYGRAAC